MFDAAYIHHNGEIAWPVESAEAAINALADDGRIIYGVDAWTIFDQSAGGGIREDPVSSLDPARRDRSEDVEAGRDAALAALPDAKALGPLVHLTWGD